MRTSFISTISLNNAARSALPRLQAELAKATVELTTVRLADVGLTLGVRTRDTVELRQEMDSLTALAQGNAFAKAQLSGTQVLLDDLQSGADTFLQQLLAVPEESQSAAFLQEQARAALTAFTATANGTDGRRYILGGTNSSEKPIADYDAGPKAAVDAAFATKFTTPLNPTADPALITAAEMTAFLDNEFAALFEEPGWTDNWSSASSTNRTTAISPSERVEVSANANESPMRKLAMAYTMVGELGAGELPPEVFQLITAKARDLIGAAIGEITRVGARLGTAQNRVEGIAEHRLAALEAIDPAEAKTRVDSLTTQISMSYSLTSQILKMSILQYA
jgi:flagellar hook-associated protein 3 FlgL